MRKRASDLAGLDVLRGIAALGVMLFHVSGQAFENQFGMASGGGVFRFGYAGLDLFFVLSGFIIFHVHGADIGQPARLATYGWRRVSRIYPAYWVVTLLYVALAIASHTTVDPRRLLHSLALIPDVQPFLAVAWTLSHELLFYGVFALLIAAPASGRLAAALWLAGSVAFLGSDDPLLSFLFNLRHLEFFLGAAVAFALRRDVIRWPLVLIGAGVAMFAITAALYMQQEVVSGTPYIIAYGIASGLLIAGVARADMAQLWRMPAWARLIGEASYSIYLTHLLAFSLLARILIKLHAPSWLPGGILLALIAAALCGVGVGFHLAVEKPLLVLARRIGRADRRRADLPEQLLTSLGLPPRKQVFPDA